MKPLTNTNEYQSLKTCDNTHCHKCLVCSETNFEESRSEKLKEKTLSGAHALYQSLFLLQLRNKIAHSR
jgi:hypothetical protein